MKLPALCLAALLMCSCVGVDGRSYVVLSVDAVHATYAQGVIDYCIEDSAAELNRLGAPAISPVLTAVVQTCLDNAHRLLREKVIETMPEIMPSIKPHENGKGKL